MTIIVQPQLKYQSSYRVIADGREVDATSKHKLDWCKVHLKPDRDMDLEYFSSPSSLIASMNLEFEHDKQVRTQA